MSIDIRHPHRPVGRGTPTSLTLGVPICIIYPSSCHPVLILSGWLVYLHTRLEVGGLLILQGREGVHENIVITTLFKGHQGRIAVTDGESRILK